tara:strand:+ start:962 stop:8479 length:7518 start_codon:yes stop_codon:yes gene_type:complete
MPAQTNTNVSPYYDDFDPNDNFYRVLYKAGFPVQARELTQSQSILQDQIEKLSSRFLKDGENVVPGEFSLGNPVAYARVSSITVGSTVDEYVGYKLRGATSGVVAFVNYATAKTDDDDATFYLNYETSGITSEYSQFIEGETLESTHPNLYTSTVGETLISKPIDKDAVGQGSLFTVTGGSYFINGFIVRNDAQTIALDKYSAVPTYEVGFLVAEEFVTSSDDPSLLDNSQGSSNFAAPGADRLRISLKLSKRVPGATDPNFIQLASIQNGSIIGKPDQTVKWDWLYDIMAKRTYDESGDYIIQDFPIDKLEYWNDAVVDGVFNADEQTGLYPPVPGSDNPEKLTFAEAEAKYALKIGAGKAYVQGYQVGFNNPLYVYGDKPRKVNYVQNTLTQISPGYNITITNAFGSPDVQCVDGDGIARAFDDVVLYRNFIDGYVGESTDATGRPLNTGNKPWVTYHIIADGVIGSGIPAESVIFNEGNTAVLTSGTDIKRGDTVGGATALVVNKIAPVPSGVIKPRYMIPNQRVDNQDGTFGYNSTYKLGIMTSTYFTELFTVDVNEPLTDWIVGDLVYGEESSAIGLVEEGSNAAILLVSNIIGEFISGEEVTQNNKVSRILKEGEVYGFQFPAVGDLSGASSLIVKAIGSETTLDVDVDYLYDSTTESLIITEAGRSKLLNFPYPEGSVLNTRINYLVTTSNGIEGYALTLDSKITSTLSKTKSVFSVLADTNDFSGDISVQNNTDSEIVDIANRSLFSGTASTNFITCDNLSGDPTEQLVAGDVVTFVDDEGDSVSRLVLFATRPVGYGELRSKSRIYFTTTIPNRVTGKTVQRIRVQSGGAPDQNLIFQLPKNIIASLESDPDATRINYQVYKEFLVNISSGASTVTLVTNQTNETFVADPNKTVIVVAKNISSPSDGSQIEGRNITATVALQDNGRKAVYTLDPTFAVSDNLTLKVLAPVFVSNATSKRKKLLEDQQLVILQENAGAKVISMGKPDIFRVKSIMMRNLGELSIDVTDNYLIDNGQRDNVYQLGRIILKPGFPAATEQLTVTYSYFQHSNEGDFFSVDSYTDSNEITYGEIPTYIPTNGTPQSSDEDSVIRLGDCADFRPVVNSTGASSTVIPTIVDGRSQQGAVNFNDSTFRGAGAGKPDEGDAFVPRIPISGTQFQCDIEYYLPKVDSLFLEKDGSLNLVAGVPADKPLPPADLSTGIRLYDIYLPQYTFSIKNCKIKKFNYKVYRMSDIANINRRIDRLEELVTLSLLEQSTLNMSVRDAVTGLERFKNGIVVDTFRTHERGEINSSQYRNSIDNVNTHLRAAHFTDQVELEQISQTDGERLGNGYKEDAGIVTCNYESVRIIQNPLATRFINLQPYTVFTYDGNLTLTPSVDTWQVTNRLPDLVIEDNNLFNAFVGFSDEMAESGIGTQWGEWETTGQNTTTDVVRITNSEGNPLAVRNALNSLAINGTQLGEGDLNEGGRNLLNNGGNPPLVIRNNTTTTNQARDQTATRINVGTARVERTSYGDRVVDVKLADTMRSVPVIFQAYRLKPNTRYYAFFDDIEVTDYCSPDTMNNDFPDGLSRYTGNGGTTNSGFGLPLISDDVGTLAGLFLIPSGRAPLTGTVFTSTAEVELQNSGPTRSFHTGTRMMKFTSSATNANDLSQVEGFAEANFYAQGVFMDKQETIVSTRIPDFSHTTTVIASETRVQTSTSQEANYFDPVAQSFLIDKNNAEGVFVTELDIFFRTKDVTQGVEAYLVSTDGQVPTENILPHSRVVKNTDTILRAVIELGGAQDRSYSLPSGTTILGNTSGSTGTIKSTTIFEPALDNPVTNIDNHVYNILLDNYNGEFIAGEGITINLTSTVENVNPTITLASDEFVVTRVDIENMGTGYSTASLVEFTNPELPGGTTATGTCDIGPNGEVFRVNITNPGKGYIRIPSATIVDASGADCVLHVRAKEDLKAVDMGVSTSEDATVSTKFKFHAPVYLLGNTNYAFVVKAPTSLNYTVWTSKLGENLLGTDTRVVEQPNMGALFMSQNGGLWTEDQTQDMAFRLWRAEFDVNTEAFIKLRNAPLELKSATRDPIETSSTPASDPGSIIFGDNPQIVRVFAYNHGLSPQDVVIIDGVVSEPGDIPNEEFNTLHEVINSTINTFTIKVTTPATTSGKGGGAVVKISANRPYEVVNMVAGAMSFGSSAIIVTNRGTQAPGLSGYNSPFQYRLDTPQNLALMDTFYYNGAKMVASAVNEAKYSGSLYLQKRKSLESTITIATFNSKVSPVIDVDRTNLTVVRNLIDNPQPDDDNFGVTTRTVTFDSSIPALTKGANITVDGRTVRVVDSNPTTKKLKLSGVNAKSIVKTSTFADTLESIGVASVTATPNTYFIPETSNNGSVYAKWVSRLFLFENPCDGVEVKIAAIFYQSDNIKLYFRPRNIGFDGDIADVNWIPFNGTGLPDNYDQIVPRAADNIDPSEIIPNDWQSLTWTVQDTAKFDGIAVKIVMTSDNPALAPLIDDIQIIATE